MSRRAFWWSFVLAWGCIIAIVAGALAGKPDAVGIATIAMPSFVALIAALLGIHRAFGSQDMRTVADSYAPTYAPAAETGAGPNFRAPAGEPFTEGGR